MYFFKGEDLNFLNQLHYKLIDNYLVSNEISRFNFRRNSNLTLNMEIELNGNDNSFGPELPQGSVYKNNKTIILVSQLNEKNKIVCTDVNITNITSNNEKTIKQIKVQKIDAIFSEKEINFIVEWIDNIPTDFLFDIPIKNYYKQETSLHLEEIKFSLNDNHQSFDKCIKIDINNCEIYMGKLENSKKGEGFIIYKKNIDENERRKIRDCISFLLGKPLIYLGFNGLSREGQIVSMNAISANDFNGAYKIVHTPPTLLSSNSYNMIDSKIFSTLVNELVGNYDKYNFRHLFWIYFYAKTSPIHISAGQYGAGIEFLLDIYLKKNDKKIKTKLLTSEKWNQFRKAMISELDKINLEEDERKLLENKIGNLNGLPLKLKMERVLGSLNTSLSELEHSAWQQRNDSSHGNTVKNDDYITFIRNVKILKSLFHRLVLLVIGSQQDYINYFALNHPIFNCIDGVKE